MSQRHGQYLFNLFASNDPEFAEKLQASLEDPFYNDARCWQAIERYIKHKCGKPPTAAVAAPTHPAEGMRNVQPTGGSNEAID